LGRRPAYGALVAPDLETQLRPIGVTDVEVLTVLQVDGGNPPIVDVHAVEAAVVYGDPSALVEPQHKVRAGDQRMCDTDVGAKPMTTSLPGAKVRVDPSYRTVSAGGAGRLIVSNSIGMNPIAARVGMRVMRAWPTTENICRSARRVVRRRGLVHGVVDHGV
jgi:hypothetical protein